MATSKAVILELADRLNGTAVVMDYLYCRGQGADDTEWDPDQFDRWLVGVMRMAAARRPVTDDDALAWAWARLVRDHGAQWYIFTECFNGRTGRPLSPWVRVPELRVRGRTLSSKATLIAALAFLADCERRHGRPRPVVDLLAECLAGLAVDPA